MLYGKYLFTCLLQNDAILPPYKGSTFRGVFGKALRDVVCALKRETCAECLLRQRCVYAVTFETHLSSVPARSTRIASPPHPFVIEPPLTTETHFQKGSPFSFDLLLFGESNRSIPYFIYAIEQMGRLGIGKRVGGKRGPFTLEEVTGKKQVIYSSRDRTLKMGDSFDNLSLSPATSQHQGSFRLVLSLVTPLRLKFQNRLHAELPFHILVRAMLRRVSSLFNAYGEGEPQLDYSGLVKLAEAVRVVDSHLGWFEWERYSSRQEQEMLMGGMVGAITYEGELGEYLPLLEFCSEVHLGKQTSFGLGKFRWEIVE